jgi:hypothetical protein
MADLMDLDRLCTDAVLAAGERCLAHLEALNSARIQPRVVALTEPIAGQVDALLADLAMLYGSDVVSERVESACCFAESMHDAASREALTGVFVERELAGFDAEFARLDDD